jgi:hypothetical protein
VSGGKVVEAKSGKKQQKAPRLFTVNLLIQIEPEFLGRTLWHRSPGWAQRTAASHDLA